MNTLFVSKNGNVSEFSKGFKGDIVGLDLSNKSMAVDLTSGDFIEVICFEDFEIGERISSSEKVFFIREPRTLMLIEKNEDHRKLLLLDGIEGLLNDWE